jgi:hypothetical protein
MWSFSVEFGFAWEDAQSSRCRDAIYGYYSLVTWWAAEGKEVERARLALRLRGLEVSGRGRAICRCYSVHRRRRERGQADQKQVVETDAPR